MAVHSITTTAIHRRTGADGRWKATLASAAWWFASMGLFLGLWELAWAMGWIDPRVLPPPHLFMPNLWEQAKYFDAGYAVAGQDTSGPMVGLAVGIASTILRVLVGLTLGFVCAVAVGFCIRCWGLFGNLVLPTVTLLAPISPLAWLPIAIYTFGVGNGPAVFLVFVAVFFVIVLATINDIDSVPKTYVDAARNMGASSRQIFLSVVLPTILPGLFLTLRTNLFGAWMVVLVAESAGVGSGLGQVIMIARNSFNPTLVFFTIGVIGIVGYLFDATLNQIQKRVLHWLPDQTQVGAL